VALTGAMAGHQWGIVAPSDDGATLPVRESDLVRLTLANQTMMWHPIQLHGHTF
jgi:FtsP/CotA-like multicopper oxidase with cupredoxin domain